MWARLSRVRLYTTRYSHRFLASYLLRSCCAGTRRADANRSNMTNTAKTLYIYRSSCGTIVVFTVLRRSRMASVLDGATARAARKFSDSPRRTIETTFVAPQRSACSNQSSARSWQGAPQPGTSTNSDLRPATSRGGGGGGARNSAAPGGGGALVPGGASAPTATSTGGTSSNVTRIVCCIAVSAPTWFTFIVGNNRCSRIAEAPGLGPTQFLHARLGLQAHACAAALSSVAPLGARLPHLPTPSRKVRAARLLFSRGQWSLRRPRSTELGTELDKSWS